MMKADLQSLDAIRSMVFLLHRQVEVELAENGHSVPVCSVLVAVDGACEEIDDLILQVSEQLQAKFAKEIGLDDEEVKGD